MTDINVTLQRLIDRGVLTGEQAAAVAAELAVGGAPQEGLRRRLAEIAGYVGGAFVVGATFLFLGQQWDALGRGGRSGVLTAMAIALFGAGLGALLSGPRGQEMRRRLASTLMTGAAGVAGFGAHVALDGPRDFTWSVMTGGLVALGVAIAGYVLARSAAGQLGVAVAAAWVVFAGLEVAHAQSSRPFGVGLLVLGVAWNALLLAGWARERRAGLGIAVTFALVGAQVAIFGTDGSHYVGHALTALVAAGCFVAYTHVREWIVLAGGVVGATLVVPEFLYDTTHGSLGASGVMLVAGVTLLGGSVAGLRLRRADDVPSM
jgi:hypothetical protein